MSDMEIAKTMALTLALARRIARARGERLPQPDPYYVGRILPGSPVIAKELKKAGYTTAHVGKWHISGVASFPTPIQQGFDFSFDEHHQYNDPEIYDRNDPKQANFSGLFLDDACVAERDPHVQRCAGSETRLP